MKAFYVLLAFAAMTVSCNTVKKDEVDLETAYKAFLTAPHGYVAQKTTGKITIDGRLDEQDWQNAPVIENFSDISGEGFPEPLFKTRARILWDKDNLYISAELDDPNVWAYLTERDEVIYHDNDFEIFFDPDGDGHNYFEVETNAIGNIFDLFLEAPYRCPSRPFVTFGWDVTDIQLKTTVKGTLNNSKDEDQGWVVEMAIPVKSFRQEFNSPLFEGNYIRLGFSRVEWQTETLADGKIVHKADENGKSLPEYNWTWPATGKIDMHMPERWGFIYFSKTPGEEFVYPEDYAVERVLWAMFYRQQDARREDGAFLTSLKVFNFPEGMVPQGCSLSMENGSDSYVITATKADGSWIKINQDGKIVKPVVRK